MNIFLKTIHCIVFKRQVSLGESIRHLAFARTLNLHHSPPCLAVSLVGSSGLEPPTSRLSGARSNHLSYEPTLVSVYLVPLTHWWRWWESNPWPPACRAGALPAELHPHILGLFYWVSLTVTQNWTTSKSYSHLCALSRRLFFGFGLYEYEQSTTRSLLFMFSIERRWSSRTFRYGYLVTT